MDAKLKVILSQFVAGSGSNKKRLPDDVEISDVENFGSTKKVNSNIYNFNVWLKTETGTPNRTTYKIEGISKVQRDNLEKLLDANYIDILAGLEDAPDEIVEDEQMQQIDVVEKTTAESIAENVCDTCGKTGFFCNCKGKKDEKN